MHPETKEIIIINEVKEPNWKFKYLHHSWIAFNIEGEELVAEPVKKVVRRVAKRKPLAKKRNVPRKD